MKLPIDHAGLRVAAGLACALAASAIASCGGGSSDAARLPRGFYGITSLAPLDRKDFVRMGRADVGAFRFEISWSAVQASRRAPFDWSPIDHTVVRAARQGIALLPILIGTPRFDAPRCHCTSTIRVRTRLQRAGWQRFVRGAVRRYGRGGSLWHERPSLPRDPITKWQIWNEQNNPVDHNPPRVYARLVALSRRAISSVDRTGELVLGGMFGTPNGSRKAGVSAWSYLNRLFKDGAGRDFDAVALHPYAPNLAGISYQIRRVRAVLDAHHAGSMPILVTEIGWGSSKERFPGTGSRGQVFNVGLEAQERKLESAFQLLTDRRRSWRIGAIFWFTWKDPRLPAPGLCAFCYSAGLYRANGRTAKPALRAYQSFTHGSRPAR